MIKIRTKLLLYFALICIAVAGIYVDSRVTRTRFDSAEWKKAGHRDQHSYPRLEMADELIRSRLLYGKTKDELIEVLGEPSDEGYFRRYDLVYWLGPERSWIDIDSEWLVIKLDDEGRVKEYKLERD